MTRKKLWKMLFNLVPAGTRLEYLATSRSDAEDYASDLGMMFARDFRAQSFAVPGRKRPVWVVLEVLPAEKPANVSTCSCDVVDHVATFSFGSAGTHYRYQQWAQCPLHGASILKQGIKKL